MDWIPEAYPKAGGLAAAGFYKLLGRPRLDPLTVLVRETAQNSWDARLSDVGSIRLAFWGCKLPETVRSALFESFPDAAKAHGTELAKHLSSPSLEALYICDRDTIGLGGPLSADEASDSNVYDWVDFVLNVGKANTQGHSGGTYGFGKTISYIVSSANTVVIHSRAQVRNRLQSRLIACAIGDEFKRGGRLYTGRHWWGDGADGTPKPIVGRAADRLARALGFPRLGSDETGTSVMIIAPDFGGRTLRQGMNYIVEASLWHLWPKLLQRGARQYIDLSVALDGENIPVPSVESRPPLQGFVQAFDALTAQDSQVAVGAKLEEIVCERPKTIVGHLVTIPLVHRDRVIVDDGSDPLDHEAPPAAAVISGVSHHVALLRSPELVIDYLEGPAPTEGGTEWAGVFRAEDEHDAKFAASEPPTHDTWNPALLPKSQDRTVVNVGLRNIREALDVRWSRRAEPAGGDQISTALVSADLAHLVQTVSGRDSGNRPGDESRGGGGGRAGGRRARPTITVLGTRPVKVGDRVATAATLIATPARGEMKCRVQVDVGAALDGKHLDYGLDPHLSLIEARYLSVIQPLTGHRAVLDLVGGEPVTIDVVVARGDATTVLFDLTVEGE